MANILEIENLSVTFNSSYGKVEAVRDVSLSVKKGEILAIVGESGCGKSVLCKSVMRLLPKSASVSAAKMTVAGKDVLPLKETQLCAMRGTAFSMIFQDPMASLNPTLTIEAQIAEAILAHDKTINKKELHNRVIELMDLVGIEQSEVMCKLYPYNFSGGMRQRIVIAIAIALHPSIIFADEPTTALDVTIQAQILDILMDIRDKFDTSIVLVTHDLGVVARTADRVAVMYAGKIVEIGTTEEIFYDAKHPYTWGLMKSLPSLAKVGEELYTIPGMPPSLINLSDGDAFAPRNAYALKIDYEKQPPLFSVSDTHYAATWLLDPRAPKVSSPIKEIDNE